MILATVIAGGFAGAVLVSGVVADGIVKAGKLRCRHERWLELRLTRHLASPVIIIEAPGQAEPYDDSHSLHKKQGPHAYGGDTPSYANDTSTSGTLTVTLATTIVATETVIPLYSVTNSSAETTGVYGQSGSIPMPTVTTTVTPFITLPAPTVTDSGNYTVISFTVDAQTNSMTR